MMFLVTHVVIREYSNPTWQIYWYDYEYNLGIFN